MCEDADEPLRHVLAFRNRRQERGTRQATGEEEEEEPEVEENKSEPLPQYEAGLPPRGPTIWHWTCQTSVSRLRSCAGA